MSTVTNQGGGVVSSQQYDPWGKVRTGGISVVDLNYTGQRKDDTGLLYYHARYYDPSLARFVSPDSIVPGASSGVGGAGGTVGAWQNSKLTVDMHETSFLSSASKENALTLQKGFWFQLSHDDRQHSVDPSGPDNPQALARYSYVQNNPLRYVDPSGHQRITRQKASEMYKQIQEARDHLQLIAGLASLTLISSAAVYAAVAAAAGVITGALAAILGVGAPAHAALMDMLIDPVNAEAGVAFFDWLLKQFDALLERTSAEYVDIWFTIDSAGNYAAHA